MAIFNYAHKEITAKIVYYGAALCGKTTNLRYIYNNVDNNKRNDLISLETEGDRTLFFDLLPLEIGKVKGFTLRLQLYTVPGQVYYNATRKLVLNGTDGVVFVADSQNSRLEANAESLENLIENLSEQDIKLSDIPWMLQINKRDLPNISPVGKLLQALDFSKYDVPYTKAVAPEGIGVFETLKMISKMVVRDLEKKLVMPNQKPEKEAGSSLLSRIQSAQKQSEMEKTEKPEPVQEEVNLPDVDFIDDDEEDALIQTDGVEIQNPVESDDISESHRENDEFVPLSTSIEEEDELSNENMVSSGETEEDFSDFDELTKGFAAAEEESNDIPEPNMDFSQEESAEFETQTNPFDTSFPDDEPIVEDEETPELDNGFETNAGALAPEIEEESTESESTGKELTTGGYEIPPDLINIIPPDIVAKFNVVPLQKQGRVLTVAMTNPNDIFVIDDIRFLTGLDIKPVLGTFSSIKKTIDKYYKNLTVSEPGMKGDLSQVSDSSVVDFDNFDADKELAEMEENIGDLDSESLSGDEDELPDYIENENFNDIMTDISETIELDESESESQYIYSEVRSDDAPIVKIINAILVKAFKEKASDIHFEPYEKEFRVRFRSDGKLRTVQKLPLNIKAPIASRIKIMANLDISERRVPQDGRIKLKIGGNAIDFRTSVLPTLFGEKVVLRLLDMSNLALDLTKLGFEEKALNDFMSAINLPFGIILVTGPTGSGKSTTLYSSLALLNDEDVNIMTAEDPVEFNFGGINQVQVNEGVGLTFASALRSFLRQDPDIILVGETRDLETAEIAIQAALTGHLVLSTLHTNDAPATINRLLNMGVKDYLIAAAVKLVCAQRLAKRICSNCKTEKEKTEKDIELLLSAGATEEEAHEATLYYGKGCEKCNGTGLKGRTALYEVMPVNEDTIGELILKGASTNEIRKKAREEGMLTLREVGLKKVLRGEITLEEVFRITMQ